MSWQKAKGTWLETLAEKFLKAAGLTEAHRIALHGKQDRGDVFVCWVAGKPSILECKNRVQTSMTGWLNELRGEMINAGAEIGGVLFKLKGIGERRPELLPVVTTFGVWARMHLRIKELEAKVEKYEAKHGPLD